jgi:hypothetical protein
MHPAVLYFFFPDGGFEMYCPLGMPLRLLGDVIPDS